jgi:hypothetical protein
MPRGWGEGGAHLLSSAVETVEFRVRPNAISRRVPCRELWYRASLAWQDLLGRDEVFSGLVAAHNAVNQVLISPVSYTEHPALLPLFRSLDLEGLC